MARWQDEDPDEQEARRKRRFLEDGARVSLETIRRYPPVNRRLVVGQAATVELPDTADLATRLSEDRDAEAVVTLDFADLQPVPDFSVLVFVNSPNANPDTLTAQSGYVGTVSFFVGEDHDEHKVRVRLPARLAIENRRRRGAVQVTLIPVNLPGRPARRSDIGVTTTVELARSRVA